MHGRYGTFVCLNCGRKQPKDKPNQKFCSKKAGAKCHDKFWNKGNRKLALLVSKIENLEQEFGGFNQNVGRRLGNLEQKVFGGTED